MGYPHWKPQNVSFGGISPVSVAAPSQSTSWERPALEPHCHDDHKMIIRTIRTIYEDLNQNLGLSDYSDFELYKF